MATFETADFKYEPSHHVPFKDKKILEQMRDITRDDFVNHPNPNLDVKVMKEADIGMTFFTDVFTRIRNAMEAGENNASKIEVDWDKGY